MPIVGYKPAEEPPQPLAFFGYGCCVSTTQSLWMIIGTFVLAVVMIVSCCFAAVFVRWVYKRRMRKKLQNLKDKYSQEEKHKKEIETNLRELAKRPILRPPRNPTTSAMKSIEKSLQQMSTKRSNEQFNPAGQTQQNQLQAPALKAYAPMIPPQIKKSEPEKKVEKAEKAKGPLPPKYFVDTPPGPILFESKTMAGVVHQLAQTGACRRSNQPPFPGIAVKEHRKMEEKKECQEETTQKDDGDETEETQKDESPVEGQNLPESSEMKKKKSTERRENEKRSPQKDSQELEIDVTQDQEEKMEKKKSKQADFPYWKGSSPGQSSNSPTSTAKTDQSSRNTVTSDSQTKNEDRGKSKDGSPSIQKTQPSASPSFRNTPPQAFNVYELRRIAEQQARVAETERAKELLGERATAIASKGMNVEEIRKRMGGQPLPKHSASVVNTKDVPSNEDSWR